MPASTAKLLRLYNALLQNVGPQRWWPADSPWEMMVGAILTQNTAWTNVEKAIAKLKEARVLSVPKMASLPRRRLERLIRSAGYFRQKADRLQRFARVMKKNPRFYHRLLGTRRDKPLPVLRETLLAQHGIGPETADSILLYAGGYPAFVVDAYTRRIGRRMGLFRTEDYGKIQSYFERGLPRKPKLYNEFHALLVMLAKHYCTSRNPKCRQCPAVALCRTGKRILS